MEQTNLRKQVLHLETVLKRMDKSFLEVKDEDKEDLKNLFSTVFPIIILELTLNPILMKSSADGVLSPISHEKVLLCIHAYMNDEFTLTDDFFIEESRNKKFSEISFRQQNYLHYLNLHLVIASPTSSNDDINSLLAFYKTINY